MPGHLSAKVLTIGELFSGAYRFRLPWFQRAYAWHTAEVGRLVSSLMQAMRTPGAGAGKGTTYPLGMLMLAKKDGQTDTALVDGHQRVMTLTLLFSVLRDLEQDANARAALDRFIAEPRSGEGRRYRLTPQPMLEVFIERLVQAPGATRVEPQDDIVAMSETERNVVENRDYLRSRLSDDEIGAEKRQELGGFLAERCIVCARIVPDEDEAWEMLQIEEDTRLKFNASDRAKANLLSVMPAQHRPRCGRIWEDCERLLGGADMHNLLRHARTLALRRRSSAPVEAELCRHFRLDEDGLSFMETMLLAHAKRLAALRNGPLGRRRDRNAIRRCVEHCTWIDRNLWVPAALLWLAARGEDNAETLLFFRRLERLVWIMRIAGIDPTTQEARILRLLGEIDRAVPVDKMRELQINAKTKKRALSNLRSPSLYAKHYSAQVLRRVSTALGSDPGPVDKERVTIEHILPQSPPMGRKWWSDFATPVDVRAHVHRLGNLTFLSSRDNRAADTFDWPQKKNILRRSDFELSRRAAKSAVWDAHVIMERTDALIALLLKEWDLGP